ncbi:PH domain-containing protein [Nocardioides yefusunii]|uniref:PH domain-containing protein n=1 Tax=Nocardioides yefusunii TaxID=2500546 RepID=A0ABW1QT30_9ACTN|nr:PH domain-containing protein [Nocardioides yefusunii]
MNDPHADPHTEGVSPVHPPVGLPADRPADLPQDTWVTAAQGPEKQLPLWGAPDPGDDEGWERLSAKKLLLDPLSALKSMLFPLIALVFGASSGEWWIVVLMGGVVVIGTLGAIVPWFTHRFRVTDTRLQFRTGILSTNILSAPLERIRSVDLDANVLHRILGLRNIKIGTGVDDDRIELNGMEASRAEALRVFLLARREAAQTPATSVPTTVPDDAGIIDPGTATADAAAPPQTSAAAPARVLATIDWTWLRFAPFDLTRMAVVAAVVGFAFQILSENVIPASVLDSLDDQAARAAEAGAVLLVVSIVVGVVLAWLLLSVVGYVVQWWGLHLTSDRGTLTLSHGLLNTRSISVEEKRIRGVELQEPLLLRPVKGANLFTLATGVGSEGTTRVLPQAPTGVARRIGGEILTAADPMQVALLQHGPAARRRSHLRQQWFTLFLLVAGVVAHRLLSLDDDFAEIGMPVWVLMIPALLWAPVAVWRAQLGYAHLGHAISGEHLVAGSGTTTRTRTVLELDGIIGWNVDRTWFQRRLGLCTLTATTAAGSESVQILDVDEATAIRLVAACTPGMAAPFLAR